jgi:hypothetical protein
MKMTSEINKFKTYFIYPFYYEVDKNRLFNKITESKRWKTEEYSEYSHYDRIRYFHPYTQEFLSNISGNQGDLEGYVITFKFNFDKRLFVSIFGHWEEENGKYSFDEKYVFPDKPEIDSVFLHLFPFGVGMLSIGTIRIDQIDNPISFDQALDFNFLFRYNSLSFKDQKSALKFSNIQLLENGCPIKDTKETYELKKDINSVSKVVEYFLKEVIDAQGLPKRVFDERMFIYSYVALKDGFKLSEADFCS